ncbi:hypothetical protein, partial [Burkholderia cenocepacia]|uniref:hypothetical protein n=1 Tax=Burkholderia cenocepacia TaxID=95486 RepID=UPI00406CFCA4
MTKQQLDEHLKRKTYWHEPHEDEITDTDSESGAIREGNGGKQGMELAHSEEEKRRFGRVRRV